MRRRMEMYHPKTYCFLFNYLFVHNEETVNNQTCENTSTFFLNMIITFTGRLIPRFQNIFPNYSLCASLLLDVTHSP